MIQINWVQISILIGAIQAMVLCVLLLRKKDHRKANYLLAAVVLIIGRMDFDVLLDAVNWTKKHPITILLFNDYLLTLGALVFFYVQSMTQPSFRFGRRFWRVMITTLFIDLCFAAVIYHWLVFKSYPKVYIVWFSVATDLVSVVVMVTYLALSFRMLQRYETSIQNNFTNLDKLTLHWLQTLVKIFILLVAYWAAVVLVDVCFFNYEINDVFYYVTSVSLVVFIYWMGFSQYLSTHITVVVAPQTNHQMLEQATKPTNQPKSVLDEEKMKAYAKLLTQAMQQDELYLNPALTLDIVANHLNIPARYVSQTLNQLVGKNLNDFVNEYRIGAVKARLMDEQYAHLTILGIAFEAGFNSKATFQRMFKKIVGVSPSEYKKQMSHPSIKSKV